MADRVIGTHREDEPARNGPTGGIRKGADSSVARLPESRSEPFEAVAGDREYSVHGRFELELPVSAVGLQPKEPDAGDKRCQGKRCQLS